MKKQYYRMAIGVFLATVLMTFFSQRVSAQMQDPVHFSVQQKQTSPSEVSLIFSATIDEGCMFILQTCRGEALSRNHQP